MSTYEKLMQRFGFVAEGYERTPAIISVCLAAAVIDSTASDRVPLPLGALPERIAGAVSALDLEIVEMLDADDKALGDTIAFTAGLLVALGTEKHSCG